MAVVGFRAALGWLLLWAGLGSSARTECTVRVDSVHGSDDNDGVTAPVRTVQIAASRRRGLPAGCRGAATVELIDEGPHFVTSPPLVLGPGDSNTRWVGATGGSILSAGHPLLDACWARVDGSSQRWRCKLPPTVPSLALPPRTITAAGVRLREARFPNYDSGAPYSGGWLFVSMSSFIGDGRFVIGVESSTLPSFAQDPSWPGARVHIFPTRSWINIVGVKIRPVTVANFGAMSGHSTTNPNNTHYFELMCPPPASLCSNGSNSASIGPGNRFFIEGDPAALSTDGEWVYDPTDKSLQIYSLAPPHSVVLPLAATVVLLGPAVQRSPPSCKWGDRVSGRSPGSSLATLPAAGWSNCTASCCSAGENCLAVHLDTKFCYLLDRTYEQGFIPLPSQSECFVADRLDIDNPGPGPHNITLEYLIFADTTFTYFGYQEGFSIEPLAAGMPRDAALVVANATAVEISRCRFEWLGGGGCHITNGSTDVVIANSHFSHLGQTGVAASGGGDRQPSHCQIVNNSMEHVGEILSSAAGVVASTLSHSVIAGNNISFSSRWGIAVRSQGSDISYGNLIERNKLFNLALTTRDLGGLSFIGLGDAGTTVRYNCVRDVIGLDSDPSGRIWRGFFTWALYLDNWSTNYTIMSNILRSAVLGGIFVHGGSNNMLVNNVLFNNSNRTMPTGTIPGFGFPDGAQGLLLGIMRGNGPPPMNNKVIHNIVLQSADQSHSEAVIWTSQIKMWANVSKKLTIDRNIYYSPGRKLAKMAKLTPSGTWAAWQAAGWDVGSTVDIDPLFAAPDRGDFRLSPASPALRTGFIPLPPGVDQC